MNLTEKQIESNEKAGKSGNNYFFWIFLYVIDHGDLGVDIFFVLSGFLIGYILLKECDKFGPKIDIFGFYRGRFLRLWFPLVIITLFNTFGGAFFGLPPDFAQLDSLIFINNLVPQQPSHLWSVAVEFQMYFISPFIIMIMNRMTVKKAKIIPFLIWLVSQCLIFIQFTRCV